ncbi:MULTISPECIES: hypothetical protein [unclassified Thermosipho (in: thermotogales)]|uniref:hypothetical protein n=1 Tax=unclassified Thermosipho (in: thermotogales) TaxID=2676525 RepID=UPI0018CC3532|nr:hypothetical protein [Thermosipho sp. 1223]
MIRNILVFFEFLVVYVLSSFVLHVEKFTLSSFVLGFFGIYFLVFSIIASLDGKSFLFNELSRFWVYAFVPVFVYLIFLINVFFHISIDSRFSFLFCFLISNFRKLDFENRKKVAILRLFAFYLFIMGVS